MSYQNRIKCRMLLRIIIGIILGFFIASILLNTDKKNEYSSTILGVIVVVSLGFIGSSFAYGAVYGLMAFIEIFIGFFIGRFIFDGKNEGLATATQGEEEQITDLAQDARREQVKKALAKAKAITEKTQTSMDTIRLEMTSAIVTDGLPAVAQNEGEQVDPRIRIALKLIERDRTRMPDGLNIFGIIVAEVLDEWIEYNKLLDEGVLTRDEFTIMVDKLIKK